jgi:hypothetical protein
VDEAYEDNWNGLDDYGLDEMEDPDVFLVEHIGPKGKGLKAPIDVNMAHDEGEVSNVLVVNSTVTRAVSAADVTKTLEATPVVGQLSITATVDTPMDESNFEEDTPADFGEAVEKHLVQEFQAMCEIEDIYDGEGDDSKVRDPDTQDEEEDDDDEYGQDECE